jgi:hypothetical protein
MVQMLLGALPADHRHAFRRIILSRLDTPLRAPS